jgi:xylan 1,4-beta-xylosidase
VLNVFRLFAKMSGKRLEAESDGAVPLEEILRGGVRARPDVSALASLDQHKLCVLVWDYHDDDTPGPEADIDLLLENLPLVDGQAKVEHFRIDGDHSNAFTAWKRIGSPQQPAPEQYALLEKAGRLATVGEPESVHVAGGRAILKFKLPRQAVSLLQLTW